MLPADMSHGLEAAADWLEGPCCMEEVEASRHPWSLETWSLLQHWQGHRQDMPRQASHILLIPPRRAHLLNIKAIRMMTMIDPVDAKVLRCKEMKFKSTL